MKSDVRVLNPALSRGKAYLGLRDIVVSAKFGCGDGHVVARRVSKTVSALGRGDCSQRWPQRRRAREQNATLAIHVLSSFYLSFSRPCSRGVVSKTADPETPVTSYDRKMMQTAGIFSVFSRRLGCIIAAESIGPGFPHMVLDSLRDHRVVHGLTGGDMETKWNLR